jgi:hypothetical protein
MNMSGYAGLFEKGTDLLGGIMNSGISALGSYLGTNALKKGNQNAQGNINQAFAQAMGYYSPYSQIGNKYLQQLDQGLQSGQFNNPDANFQYNQAEPEYNQFKQGSYQDPGFNFKADPGLGFRMKQGTQAVEAGAASRGMQLSGATQKALAQYGQNLGSEEYGKAYGRYSNDRAFGAGQFNTEQALGFQNAQSNRNFDYSRYTGNRDFSANIYYKNYGLNAENRTGQYQRMQNMVNLGYGANQNLAQLAQQKGMSLADLAIQLGNIDAAGINSMTKIGTGMMGLGNK